MRKLMSWERSCKLKYAERLVAFSDDQHAREFLDGNKEEILADRAATWGTNKQGKALSPDRWTGRSLEQDAKKVEQFESAGFVSFYAEKYTRTCWHVHGSGVVGLLEVPTRDFPMIAASALHCGCHFSLVCFEYALRLLNVFDEISEIRISQLKETLGVTAPMILRSATR